MAIDEAVNERTYADYSRPLLWRVLMTREFAIIALLALVYFYAYGNVANFDGPLTLYYLFLDMAPIMLIALPMTLVIITGEIDLSVASIMGITSVVLGIAHHDLGLSIPLAMVLALVVGAICGAFNGFLVAYVGLPSLAVTIGTLALFRGIAVGMLGTEAITDFDELWTDLATARIGGDSSYPVILIAFAVLAIAFAVLLHFTTFGRGVYEIGLNDQAARFTGVNVERTKFLLFLLAGTVSGFAGIFYTLRYGSARGDNAEFYELQVIAAVLLGGVSIFGGRGALHGVIAGVLLIGVLSSALRLENVSTNITNIVIGGLLVLSVISATLLSWVSKLRPNRAGKSNPPLTTSHRSSDGGEKSPGE